MSIHRRLFSEMVLVIAMLTIGISAADAVHASPLTMAVQAADPRAKIKIKSVIKVQRSEPGPDGRPVISLLNPADVTVVPGDMLIFTNRYENTGDAPVTGFVVNNPIHKAVSFAAVQQDWALVSVDGGRTYDQLSALSVTDRTAASDDAVTASVTRAAQPADVTHIRWIFAAPIAPRAAGELQFTGTVK